MTSPRTLTALGAAAAVVGTGLAGAAPAAAGGIGDFLSPAFGTSCANLAHGARADGATSHGTGAVGGNVAGLPVGSALNQCGGADLPAQDLVQPGALAAALAGGTNVPDTAVSTSVGALTRSG